MEPNGYPKGTKSEPKVEQNASKSQNRKKVSVTSANYAGVSVEFWGTPLIIQVGHLYWQILTRFYILLFDNA